MLSGCVLTWEKEDHAPTAKVERVIAVRQAAEMVREGEAHW